MVRTRADASTRKVPWSAPGTGSRTFLRRAGQVVELAGLGGEVVRCVLVLLRGDEQRRDAEPRRGCAGIELAFDRRRARDGDHALHRRPQARGGDDRRDSSERGAADDDPACSEAAYGTDCGAQIGARATVIADSFGEAVSAEVDREHEEALRREPASERSPRAQSPSDSARRPPSGACPASCLRTGARPASSRRRRGNQSASFCVHGCAGDEDAADAPSATVSAAATPRRATTRIYSPLSARVRTGSRPASEVRRRHRDRNVGRATASRRCRTPARASRTRSRRRHGRPCSGA
jgi:hypothetical protein